MQAKEIKERFKLLIQEASAINPNLAKRLDEINRWFKDIKTGSLTAKPLLMLFLEQILRDAEALIILMSLPSQEEQQSALEALTPTLKYWYGYLFPKWLSENDPKFYIWKQKLKAGEFYQDDAKLLEYLANSIKDIGGTVVRRYIVDLSMATDIIVSSRQKQPLCIQLTSLSEEFSQEKSDHWQNTLLVWKIDRGLFLSYNPCAVNYVEQIINISLDKSDNLPTGIFLKVNL